MWRDGPINMICLTNSLEVNPWPKVLKLKGQDTYTEVGIFTEVGGLGFLECRPYLLPQCHILNCLDFISEWSCLNRVRVRKTAVASFHKHSTISDYSLIHVCFYFSLWCVEIFALFMEMSLYAQHLAFKWTPLSFSRLQTNPSVVKVSLTVFDWLMIAPTVNWKFVCSIFLQTEHAVPCNQ